MNVCCVCQKEKKDNLYILGKLICDDCEWRILKAKAHQESYSRFAKKLGTLICEK